MPNYNMEILDADNLTITAGELMRLANSAVVLMFSTQTLNAGGVIITKKYIDRLTYSEYSEDDGYKFTFASGGSGATLRYIANNANDVIALSE